jgi:glutamate-1-semialdehyde 2,1-aminomutase
VRTEVIDSWPASAERWARAKQVLPGGVSTYMRSAMKPHPLFFTRGAGSHVWDADGHEYVDYVLGWGPVIAGHSHPHVVETVGRQLAAGQTFGAGHHWEYEVAEALCAAVPGAERVLWTNTGSEANQVALRLARAATGRRRFVKFEGHYHGWSDPMLIGYRPAEGQEPGLESAGQNPAALTDVTVLPWNDLDAVRAVLRDPASDVAAVFTEPVLCNSGVLEPADGFLSGLRELCDETSTLLVFDEVITGFRIAYGGASERYGVRPDLVVLAKAIAGGFPLAAVTGRAEVIDLVESGVSHAGTYNGNPIVLAAAAATMEVLRGDGVYGTFESLAKLLADGMRSTFDRAGLAASVHHVGPVVQCVPGVVGASTFAGFRAGDWELYDEIVVELLRRGVFCLPGGRWYLSTAHDEVDVGRTVDAFDAAVTAALAGRVGSR